MRAVSRVADVGWNARTVNSGGSRLETSVEINSWGNMRSSEVVMDNMLSFLRVEQAKENRYVGKGKTLVSISFAPVSCFIRLYNLYKNTATLLRDRRYALLNLDRISSPSGFPLPSLRFQSESVPP